MRQLIVAIFHFHLLIIVALDTAVPTAVAKGGQSLDAL